MQTGGETDRRNVSKGAGSSARDPAVKKGADKKVAGELSGQGTYHTLSEVMPPLDEAVQAYNMAIGKA